MNIDPIQCAIALLILAVALAAVGVYLLAGLGWALLTVSAAPLVAGVVLLRGALFTITEGGEHG